MAEYELPPLRIKIVGDGKSWERTTEQTIKQAKQLAASLEKIGSSVKASIINKSVRDSVKAIHTAIASHIGKVAQNMLIPGNTGKAVISKAIRKSILDATTLVALHVEQASAMAGKFSVSGVGIVSKAVRQSVKSLVAKIIATISGIADKVSVPKPPVSEISKAVKRSVLDLIAFVALYVEQTASLAGKVKPGGSAVVNKTMRDATKLILHYMLINIRRMVVSAHSVKVAGSGEINKTMRQASQLVLHYLLINIRRMVVSAHAVKTAGSGAVNRVMRQALDVILHSLITRIRLMAVTAHTVRGNAAPLRREIRSGIGNIINYLVLAVRSTVSQALAGISLNRFIANLRRGVQTAVNNTRFTPQPGNQNVRGGGGGFGSLGDRADIYMHQNAIRAIASGLSTFIKPMTNLETLTVQMEAFTGSVEKARSVVSELREFALISPYSMESMVDASTLLQKYGMEADLSIDAVKRLGDMAAGNNEKLHLLSLAMGQITSLGKLQGQELRQLTEHGWNPLKTIMEASGKSMEELKDLQKKGLISSEAVVAALKVETSVGGHYAGIQDKMANTTAGLVQQINELRIAIGTELLAVLDKEIKNALRTTLAYLQQFREWIQANKEAAASWVKFIKDVVISVVAFHMLGLAVAYAKWMLHSITVVALFLGGVFRFLVGTIRFVVQMLAVMRGALALTQVSLIATWITALGPVGAVVAAIAAVAGAIYLVVESLTNPDGLMGAFKSVFVYATGFFKWLSKKFGFDFDKGLMEGLGFQLDPKFMKDTKIDIPEAPVVDWNALLSGKGTPGMPSGSDVRTDFKLNESVSIHSGEAKQRRWEQQMILAGWESGAKDDKQDKMIHALENIERNTRPNGWQKAVQWIEPANLAGVP